MKKGIILVFIFLLIIGSGTVEHYFVHKTFSEFDKRTEEIEEAIKANNAQLAIQKSNELNDWWATKKHIIEAISYCPDARQVNVMIGEMIGSLEADDIKNAQNKVVSLQELTKNICELLDFNILDII